MILLYYLFFVTMTIYNITTVSCIREPKYTVCDIAYMEIMIIYIDVLAIGNYLSRTITSTSNGQRNSKEVSTLSHMHAFWAFDLLLLTNDLQYNLQASIDSVFGSCGSKQTFKKQYSYLLKHTCLVFSSFSASLLSQFNRLKVMIVHTQLSLLLHSVDRQVSGRAKEHQCSLIGAPRNTALHLCTPWYKVACGIGLVVDCYSVGGSTWLLAGGLL